MQDALAEQTGVVIQMSIKICLAAHGKTFVFLISEADVTGRPAPFILALNIDAKSG